MLTGAGDLLAILSRLRDVFGYTQQAIRGTEYAQPEGDR